LQVFTQGIHQGFQDQHELDPPVDVEVSLQAPFQDSQQTIQAHSLG
jgi:hypothetical protein